MFNTKGANEMPQNQTDSHANDRVLGDEKRKDKPIRFKAKKNIYWEDWGHMRRVFIAGRVYDGVLHSDGKVTGYSPYFDVDDYVSADEIEIVN